MPTFPIGSLKSSDEHFLKGNGDDLYKRSDILYKREYSLLYIVMIL